MKRVVVQVFDDLDGAPLPGNLEPVHLCFEGVSYALDLSLDHLGELRRLLHPYLVTATQVNHTSSVDPDPQMVRAWAEEQQLPVATRGRLSRDLLDLYTRAHPGVDDAGHPRCA